MRLALYFLVVVQAVVIWLMLMARVGYIKEIPIVFVIVSYGWAWRQIGRLPRVKQ